ncbi:MT-A70 family methyltransferase [Enterovirga rhinocerotis]|uniref:N6-adenosine-specific RNA methylase IME4 n=1 Tax=Enterovirga rhinocerotis TaxID=1339210 RepID=A0A4R7BXK7_9HYPH|nr:MT-A70 family methyltransferase [Enterovirga rhinocerotis]TDR90321.1 N6-adenosine-specific RNA methylase IME4 [Enterovirga rhinocerotis]
MNAQTLFSPLAPWPFGDLQPHAFNLIVVDFPWRFDLRSPRGEKKSAQAHYRCYPPEEMAWRFPVQELAEPSALLLAFATAPLIDRQIAVVRRMGFVFKTLTFWRKVFPSGKRAVGPGYRVRGEIEPVIIATIGEPRHQPFDGDISGVRREHSRKPDEFYRHVDARCPGLRRRADVFTRETRPGWAGWGDEATKLDEVAA